MRFFAAWEFQRLVLGIFVICSPPFIFWVRISHWTPSSSIWLDLSLLGSELQGSSCLCLIFLLNSLQRKLSICINIYYQFLSPCFCLLFRLFSHLPPYSVYDILRIEPRISWRLGKPFTLWDTAPFNKCLLSFLPQWQIYLKFNFYYFFLLVFLLHLHECKHFSIVLNN